MKTIFITGCAGLLGSNFSRYLLEKGYFVVGVDNFFGGYKEFLPEHQNFKFYEVDLYDSKEISKIFDIHKFNCVYHFAAYAAEGLSPFIRRFNYINNVVNSMSVVNECINRDIKIIFTSSMAVYGDQIPPFVETMLPKPIDSYGIAKYSVEQDLFCGSSQFNLRYNIVRPHNVLGVYQNIWDKYRNVIGIFIRQTLNNKPITIYGDGLQTRAFSDIKYYMKPFEMLIDNFDGETFNIGADKYYTILEVANKVKLIGEKHGYQTDIIHLEPRHEVKHAYCDHTKAKDKLNFTDETDIDVLIENMFVWSMGQPQREVKRIEYEISDKIYSYWK